MAWSVDQASLGTRVFEATYGDTSMTFTSNVNAAAGGATMQGSVRRRRGGACAASVGRGHSDEPACQ